MVGANVIDLVLVGVNDLVRLGVFILVGINVIIGVGVSVNIGIGGIVKSLQSDWKASLKVTSFRPFSSNNNSF